jgi:hypothetical protein
MSTRRRWARILIAWSVWTLVLGVLLLAQDPGSAPCPELAPVGLTDEARHAIAQDCEERFRASTGIVTRYRPLSWIVLWVGGAAIVALAVVRVQRR